MYPFYLEREIIKPVTDFFQKKGCKVVHEVRIGFCRADLIAYKNDTVTAVELKLKDRKKALVQAKNYQLGADYVYIAVPLMNAHSFLRKIEHRLRGEGIGLLVIHEETCKVKTIIEAKPSKKKFASMTIEKVKKRRRARQTRFF